MPAFHHFVAENNIPFTFEKFHDHHDLFASHFKNNQEQIPRREAVTMDSISDGLKDYIGSAKESYITKGLDTFGLGLAESLDGFQEDVDDAVEKADDYVSGKQKQANSINALVMAIGAKKHFGAMGHKNFTRAVKDLQRAVDHEQLNDDNAAVIQKGLKEEEQVIEHVLVQVFKTFVKDPAVSTFTFIKNVISGIFSSCLLYTSPSPRDQRGSRMPSSA